jgi:16S rRNA (guanine527-N7)-methyltransferase
VETILREGLAMIAASDADAAAAFEDGTDRAGELLQKYIEEIERFNPAYGLVGTNDRRGLVIRHILDSLAPLGIIRRLLNRAGAGRAGAAAASTAEAAPRIADIGSGAGLPGIPLAISLPRCSFTLIERMGKRAGFLRGAVSALKLFNVSVEEAEMEKSPRGRFDLVVTRAFHPLEKKLLKKTLRLCREGGALAAYKGRKEKIEREIEGLAQMNIQMDTVPCPVPFLDEERHLLVIRTLL